jgi:hypothetical protein
MTEEELSGFHDVCLGLCGKSLNLEELKKYFDMLPENIKSIAIEWTTSDTVFRDMAYEYLKEEGLL